MVNNIRVLSLLGVAVIEEVHIGDELLHRRGPGNVRVLASGRMGEPFVLRFDLANDFGVLHREGLSEAVINQRMILLYSVTQESPCCTLGTRCVISRFEADNVHCISTCVSTCDIW
jgi:hypothetical protein